MAVCYHRKLAWLTADGLKFRPVKGAERVTVPCGKCIACRVNNASQWATRVMHEAQYCESACFITLTYSPDFVPSDYALRKSDLQKFIKRLRTHLHVSQEVSQAPARPPRQAQGRASGVIGTLA